MAHVLRPSRRPIADSADPESDSDDPYAVYAAEEDEDAPAFEAFHSKKSRAKTQQTAQRAQQHLAEIAQNVDPAGAVPESGAFQTTYKPSRHEAGWLISSLGSFFDQQLLSDVLAQVKGGKEANVYRCQAGPGVPPPAGPLVAAKVYRPRAFRNLRNDKQYRDGRPVLTENGTVVKNSDERVMRALGKKTAFGEQVRHTSWLMYEFTTLARLFAAGASVPQPLGASENAILMTYAGDENRGAPTLIEVGLDPGEAQSLFDAAVRNIVLLLQNNVVHGDLSAYNILYWNGALTLIDFPQVVDPATNPHARTIFERDVIRVCDYFARQGVDCDGATLARNLWKRHGPREETSGGLHG